MTIAAYLREAESAAEANDWKGALDALTQAGDTSAVLEKRAFYLSRLGQHDAAVSVLEVLRSREPANHRWPYMIAYQFYAQEHYEEAVPWFRVALQLNPRHLKSWWRAANALDKSGHELAARRCAARVLRLWNDLPPEAQDRERKTFAKASYYLGKVQMARDPRGAVELLQQALANDPSDAYKHYRLGKALHYCGEPSAALPHLDRAVQLKRGDVSINVELADVLAICGESKRALSLLRQVESHLKGFLLRKAARTASRAGDPIFAVRLYRRAGADRVFRGDQELGDELCAAEARVRELGLAAEAPRHEPSQRLTGRVKMVNLERSFGFLVDDEGGTNRHFRLKDESWRGGDRVSYLPGETEKGSNASDVRKL
jgi:tetratricopeptide (TPR) repeat protein/cold shock CspA family protein